MLRGDANPDDRDRKAQIAEHEIRGDHLCPPLGGGQAVSGREAAHENAANRDPSECGTSQEKAQ